MMDDEVRRARARRRALRAAAAFTLGLATVTTTGCETATHAYCQVFDETQYCCTRAPGRYYDETAGRCVILPPVVGPLVPPEGPA